MAFKVILAPFVELRAMYPNESAYVEAFLNDQLSRGLELVSVADSGPGGPCWIFYERPAYPWQQQPEPEPLQPMTVPEPELDSPAVPGPDALLAVAETEPAPEPAQPADNEE